MTAATKSAKAKKRLKVILIIIAAMVVIRLVLPYVILHFANKSLANTKGYYGHIDDIDLAIYRGAYQVNDMYLDKIDSATGERTDFFKVSTVDLSIEWNALLQGSLVGELEFEEPELIFTRERTGLEQVKKDTNDFRKILKDFMPLKVNRFRINNGVIRYVDNTVNPKVDVKLTQVQAVATNLRNTYKESELLPATVHAKAVVYEGDFALQMKLNPLAEQPTFDLNAELNNTNLVLLNNFMKAYGKFDVNEGTFGLYTEFAARDGGFKGYVKPIIKNLDVVGLEDRKDSFLQRLWENVASFVGFVFKNQKKDQIATKVPIEGSFNDPSVQTLEAVWEVLKNAFVQALMPSIDQQINIQTVDAETARDDRNLVQRIFGGKKDKKKKGAN